MKSLVITLTIMSLLVVSPASGCTGYYSVPDSQYIELLDAHLTMDLDIVEINFRVSNPDYEVFIEQNFTVSFDTSSSMFVNGSIAELREADLDYHLPYSVNGTANNTQIIDVNNNTVYRLNFTDYYADILPLLDPPLPLESYMKYMSYLFFNEFRQVFESNGKLYVFNTWYALVLHTTDLSFSSFKFGRPELSYFPPEAGTYGDIVEIYDEQMVLYSKNSKRNPCYYTSLLRFNGSELVLIAHENDDNLLLLDSTKVFDVDTEYHDNAQMVKVTSQAYDQTIDSSSEISDSDLLDLVSLNWQDSPRLTNTSNMNGTNFLFASLMVILILLPKFRHFTRER